MIPIATILFGIQQAVQQAPEIAEAIQRLFKNGIPTEAEWEAERARLAGKSYKDFVPATQIPDPESPARQG